MTNAPGAVCKCGARSFTYGVYMTKEQLARLAMKLPLPWIGGNITAKEWCEAVDAILKVAKDKKHATR